MRKQALLFENVFPLIGEQISALVKSIRLRRTEDAVLWLISLWRGSSSYKARVQRRILISAAEDCLSIPVMRQVSIWYNSPARFDLQAAITEVMRIIGTPNWYATQEGRCYIQHWWETETTNNRYLEKSPGCLLQVMEHAVRNKEPHDALHAFAAYYEHKHSNRWMLAQLFNRLALVYDNRPALQLAELYESNLRYLWHDQNFSGQTLYTLIFGEVGEQINPLVSENEALQLIAQQSPLLSTGITVPSWAMDGIHCSGTDPRFAGTLCQMKAMCNAYQHYKRMEPTDAWLPQFYETKTSEMLAETP